MRLDFILSPVTIFATIGAFLIPMEYTQGIIGSIIGALFNLNYTPQQICLIVGILMLCLATLLSIRFKKNFKPSSNKKSSNYQSNKKYPSNYQSKSYKKRR